MELHPEGRKRLAKLMLIQGASQRDVAAAADWASHSYVGRLLRGKAKTLDVDAAVRIAHYFEVSIDDLFVTKSSSKPSHNVIQDKAS